MNACQECGKEMQDAKRYCVACVEKALESLCEQGFPIKRRMLPSGKYVYSTEPPYVRGRPWEPWCRTRTFHKESVETYCGRSVKEPQCWDKTKTPRRVCKECHRAVSMEATP